MSKTIFEINGKRTTLDNKKITDMDFDSFRDFCNRQSTFKDLPPKAREAKIKELYGNITANAKSGKKGKTGDTRTVRESDGGERRSNGAAK